MTLFQQTTKRMVAKQCKLGSGSSKLKYRWKQKIALVPAFSRCVCSTRRRASPTVVCTSQLAAKNASRRQPLVAASISGAGRLAPPPRPAHPHPRDPALLVAPRLRQWFPLAGGEKGQRAAWPEDMLRWRALIGGANL